MSEPAGIPGGFSRFRIDLAYDGTDFAGWAKQPGHRTIQGDLEVALTKLFGESQDGFGMRVAGRTDAGVHAAHQVCHIDVTTDQLKRLGRTTLSAKRLNSLLVAEIAILKIELAPEGFDARFSATGRRYHYLIADQRAKADPKRNRFVLTLPRSVDENVMSEAAEKLVGLKDFGAFCKPRAKATTIRNLKKLEVFRHKDGLIQITLEADAFCHNMVRAIVGAIVSVAEQRLTVAELEAVQLGGKRTSKFRVVHPRGLSLEAVSYPSDEKMGLQAKAARKRRDFGEISV
jgi:tRNA pseudouridine38-40 synthase